MRLTGLHTWVSLTAAHAAIRAKTLKRGTSFPQPKRTYMTSLSSLRPIGIVLITGAVLCPHKNDCHAESPTLHHVIDQTIDQIHFGPQGKLCTDEEFIRRVYLDLVGRIPSVNETTSFLEDPATNRREVLIDCLVDSSECDHHLATTFDLMWMERRNDKHVTTREWREYLQKSFADKIPLNELIAEILAADGDETSPRAAAKFYLDREVEPNVVARDVSRMFFGRDIQCAQCHDHPLIADYSQAEYHGMLAFFTRSYVFEKTLEKEKKVSYVAEKPNGEVSFSSVFEPGEPEQTALPGLASGIATDSEPLLTAEIAYQVAPQKNVRPIPTHSRRQQLGNFTRQGHSHYLRKNLANRLWRVMMKQGLVEPPDFSHGDNTPYYASLLTKLGDSLATHQFQTKEFLRSVARSQAYQRSIDLPEDLAAHAVTARERLPRWKQEIGLQKTIVARHEVKLAEIRNQLDRERNELIQTRQKIQALLDKREEIRKRKQEAAEKVASARASINLAENLAEAANQSTQAAKIAAKDQPLQDAAKLLRERAEQAAKKLEKQRQELDEQEMLRHLAEQEIKSTDDQLQPLQNDRHRQAILVKEISGAHLATLALFEAEQSQVIDMERQLELAREHIDYAAAAKAFFKVQAEYKIADSKRHQAVTQYAESEAVTANLTQEIQNLQIQLAMRLTRIGPLQEQLRQLQTHITAMHQAANQVADAVEDLPGDETLEAAFQRLEKRRQELTVASANLQSQIESVQTEIHQDQQEFSRLRETLTATNTNKRELLQRRDLAIQTVDRIRNRLDEAEIEQQRTHNRLRRSLSSRFVVGNLRALSAEQLAASIFQALELEPRFRSEAEAEWEKQRKEQLAKEASQQKTDDDAAANDSSQPDPDPATRAQEIAAIYEGKLSSVRNNIVKLYAALPASPQDVFHATVDQALFMSNAGQIQSWIEPSRGNLADRLRNDENDTSVAQQLYLSILSRVPTPEELTTTTDYLQSAANDRQQAVQDVIWSLVTSVEFRFNH